MISSALRRFTMLDWLCPAEVMTREPNIIDFRAEKLIRRRVADVENTGSPRPTDLAACRRPWRASSPYS